MLREPVRVSDSQYAELRMMISGVIITVPSARALCRRSFWNEDTRRSYIEGASIAILIHETPGEGGKGSACIAATEGLGKDFRSLRGISMSLHNADGTIIDGTSDDGIMFFNVLRNGSCYRLVIGEGADSVHKAFGV